jgi:hypothetical protein
MMILGQGAALGMMVALMIRDKHDIIPEVQTFGEPRVGNDVYAKYWNNRITGIRWRFTHDRDPVPQVPPQIMGFHHRGTEVFLQDREGYTVCDSTGEDPDCQNSVIIPTSLTDHLFYLDQYLWIPCL